MTRKKMGRPPKENSATEKLPNIRLLPQTLKAYKDAASASGKRSLSEWVRSNLDKAAKRDLKKLSKEEDS